MIGLDALLNVGGKLIDKLIPDPEAKAKAQLELQNLWRKAEHSTKHRTYNTTAK